MKELPSEDRPTDHDQYLANLYPKALVSTDHRSYLEEEDSQRLGAWGFGMAVLLKPNTEVATALYVTDSSTPHAQAVERIADDEARGILPESSYLRAMSSIRDGTFEQEWITYYLGLGKTPGQQG